MTDEELVARVTHRLRTSLAIIAGFSELGLTRDDATLRAEAREAVSGAVADLTRGIDEVMLSLELAWLPTPAAAGTVDLREAAEQAAVRTGGATVEPGEPVRAVGDHETVVRVLQSLLRAAGVHDAVVRISARAGRATAAVDVPEPPEPDDAELSLRNARRLAELQRGSVTVAGARLELELPEA